MESLPDPIFEQILFLLGALRTLSNLRSSSSRLRDHVDKVVDLFCSKCKIFGALRKSLEETGYLLDPRFNHRIKYRFVFSTIFKDYEKSLPSFIRDRSVEVDQFNDWKLSYFSLFDSEKEQRRWRMFPEDEALKAGLEASTTHYTQQGISTTIRGPTKEYYHYWSSLPNLDPNTNECVAFEIYPFRLIHELYVQFYQSYPSSSLQFCFENDSSQEYWCTPIFPVPSRCRTNNETVLRFKYAGEKPLWATRLKLLFYGKQREQTQGSGYYNVLSLVATSSEALRKTWRKVTIRYVPSKNERIHTCMLAGSFNFWNPLSNPMRRMEDGSFIEEVTVEEGTRYEYKFILDGIWNYDPKAPIIRDAIGNVNNIATA